MRFWIQMHLYTINNRHVNYTILVYDAISCTLQYALSVHNPLPFPLSRAHNPWVCQPLRKHCTIFPTVKNFYTLMMEVVNCDETLKWSKFYYTVWYLEDSSFHSYDTDSLKSRIHLTNFTRRAMVMRLVARFLWRKPDSISTHSIRNLLWTKRHLDTFIFEFLVLSVSFHQCSTSVFIHLPSEVKRRGRWLSRYSD